MKQNPYPKESRSYRIWEKNNNPKDKDFLFTMMELGIRVRDEDEKNVREALDVQS